MIIVAYILFMALLGNFLGFSPIDSIILILVIGVSLIILGSPGHP